MLKVSSKLWIIINSFIWHFNKLLVFLRSNIAQYYMKYATRSGTTAIFFFFNAKQIIESQLCNWNSNLGNKKEKQE